MPKVGGKTFAYTKAGKAEAKAYAKKKGAGAMNSATGSKHKPAHPTGWRINKAENGFVLLADYPLNDMLRLDGGEQPMVFADVDQLVTHLKDSLG